MRSKPLILIIILFVVLYMTRFYSEYSSKYSTSKVGITYKDAVESVDYSYEGLVYSLDKYTGIPLQSYNYLTKSYGEYLDFASGLATISAYMSTGDEKYINITKKTADLIDNILSEKNLVPLYSTKYNKSIENRDLMCGSGGQATYLELISYLAKYDNNYIPLMNKLAEGIIDYCINPSNNLCWFQVNSNTGKPRKSDLFGYESQLGSQSVSCAQALLSAYETSKINIKYKEKAIDILFAVWNTRNKETNLISESWDILNNRPGKKLYPYEGFRYDDMGGVYIRGLTMAYLITKNDRIKEIAKIYIEALVKNTYDLSINGGAFRYLSDTKGRSKSNCIETMHGLFIASLLQANNIFFENKNKDIINKCSSSADHTIISNFAVKNNMCPHAVSSDGNYLYNHNDSQLGYSIIQYPLGYNLLTIVKKDEKYRNKSNEILKTFFERHKIGDNLGEPKGFLNIVETKEPYDMEKDYLNPVWMFQAMYIPSYVLYNSIQLSGEVQVDWYHDSQPSVFGLVNDMPFWDINNVYVKGNKIVLNKVKGKGTIDLSDLGYNITYVSIDGKKSHSNLLSNKIETISGIHSYEIIFDK